MEVPESNSKEDEMSVVPLSKADPDYDKYQMEKNNMALALIAGKFTGALNIKTDINVQIQNLVEVSVKSVCDGELRDRQDTIDKLRIRITELETTLEEKEQIINSTTEQLRSIEVELKMYKGLCEKKDEEITVLRTAMSQIQMEFAECKHKAEEAERRFISEKKTLKTTYEAKISRLEKELLDYKRKSKTITKTGKSLDAKFTSMSLDIKQEWTAWFLKFKEKMPKDLKSVYKELRKKWEMEWTLEKEEEMRVQIEEEHTRKVAEMTIQITRLTEKLKRLEAQTTFHSEVQKYTEILAGIQQSEIAIRNETAFTYNKTTVLKVKAIDNQALEFENKLDKDIDMTEWTIRNEKQETIFYQFQKLRLRPNETIKVWTSQYKDLLTVDELFTNNCEDWIKAGGLVICDAKGNVVATLGKDDNTSAIYN